MEGRIKVSESRCQQIEPPPYDLDVLGHKPVGRIQMFSVDLNNFKFIMADFMCKF